ncbi:MAG: RHS repeat-associated core domain-containing protein [Bacteroidota bacterium]|nr:RHS repeat-associated core domain-containing protein [Bacteroidota bacterium]
MVGTDTTQYIWIGGDAYTAVAVAKKVGTGSWTVYNIFRDHLGSITHMKTGSTVTEYSFDAWGRRRNPTNWSYDLTSQPELFADRGFTSHEYLKYFNLYNMNGRMYDPLVGRFLNVDPYVQMPDYTQNFNRYSYCLNNPLIYTDPSGEFIFTLLATVIPGAQFLLPFAIAADISWMTDYGMQVAMNHLNGMSGSEAWLKKIDWFDVGASAVIGGATGGFGAELKAGKELGKFGTWVVKNRKLITLGEMALTSGVDITGEGFQKVDFKDFSTRMAINGVTFGLNELASNYSKKLVKSPGTKALGKEQSFFSETKYSNKVLGQMKKGDFHAFPESVTTFEKFGVLSTIKGGDGIFRQMLKIPGEYGGQKGFFEFIKEADGIINHRYFNPF